MSDESRKYLEQQFHDERETPRISSPDEHDLAYSNRRFYHTARKSKAYLDSRLKQNVAGKQVLDYCCGVDATAFQAAKHGAIVTGIDISVKSIETANRQENKLNLRNVASFVVIDAENTDFENSRFDIIICNGVLHHLDLDNAYRELARILKPDGKIICVEALANNPLIHWYRKRTPDLRTEWEVAHILTTNKIYASRRYFRDIRVKYFHLASILAIPLIGKPGFRFVLNLMDTLDEMLLRIPGIQRLAWQAIFTLSEPL